MKSSGRFLMGSVCAGLWVAAAGATARAQDAKAIVQQAVATELEANRTDNSHWRYRRSDADGSSFIVVETEHGAIGRHVTEGGKPASSATLAADDAQIQKFIHDPEMQRKQRGNGAQDDKSAVELLNLMARAFVWKIDSVTPESTTLSYRPDPSFHPPDMEARVMSAMSGSMVIDRAQHRIRTMKGRLENDVTIGFGFLARIKAGSVFDVERRQVAPSCWEITETHVHISGHALFIKTIGDQEDEVKTEYTLVPLGTTLEQAVGMMMKMVK
jgi:hypothetical protein